MTDDGNNDLARIHDDNEDAPIDWRDVLQDHLKEAVGKTYNFRLPRGEQIPFYAFEPGAFAPSADEAKRVLDEIMARPSTVVLFEDGEPTEDETAREHNERRYPDLMRRLDRLSNRPLEGDDQ